MGTTQSSDLQEIKKLDYIKFHLQNKEHTVTTTEITPDMSLNYYIRQNLNMTGTKNMCLEGGCGCCVVVLEKTDPDTHKKLFFAINSCLMPVLACNGFNIYTIEGIGNLLKGYHPVQKVLAEFNGTQCGFCSPGMVMNMYALYESGKFTMQQVEDAFSGNICRCTGYRSILSAFKSLSSDASCDILGHLPDIEDLVGSKEEFLVVDEEECCNKSEEVFYHEFRNDSKWIKVHNLRNLLLAIKQCKDCSYKLVAGNTAQGVYKSYADSVDQYIDITSIPELQTKEQKSDSYILGAGTTLADAIDTLNQIADKDKNFAYCQQLAKHISLVANVPVRNRATLGGNLTIKHDHHEFPSDIFLLLETVNAQVTVVDALNGTKRKLLLHEFIKYEMKYKVLLNIIFPSYPNSYKLITYKIMPRSVNVHAIVNAGFLFNFNNKQEIVSATIVYGNINNNFIHATLTEELLIGKDLFDNVIIRAACANLTLEVIADTRPPDPSPRFRSQLAVALFYKATLSMAPEGKVTPKNKSGGSLLSRTISTGIQDYETQASVYPLNQPITKVEALAQTSGQAQYVPDMPDLPFQLFGALVTAKAPAGSVIKKIDSSKALKVDGIVAFFDHTSIPGSNSFLPNFVPNFTGPEELLCSGKVKYYDQPVGVLVGKEDILVQNSTALVEITYDRAKDKPLLSVRQVLEQNKTDRVRLVKTIEPKKKGDDTKHVIKGSFDMTHQYHFHMETQTCNVVPTEDSLDVYASTQFMDMLQVAIAEMLEIPSNNINVVARRCGGAFGAKLIRTGIVVCPAALAAYKLKQPVKIHLPLQTNMSVVGKRFPSSVNYEVGVNDHGVIQYLNADFYTDHGAFVAENIIVETENGFMLNYNSDTFTYKYYQVRTDTQTNCFTRAPGSTEAVATIESIMEHISYTLNIDPVQVKLANLSSDSSLIQYVHDLQSWADLSKRSQEILDFNKANRWKKKGLGLSLTHFKLENKGPFFGTVSILHNDGTVQIAHGCVEIGQGINTKIVQVCAYKLGISVDSVVVKASSTVFSANNTATGASKASESTCYCVAQACDILLGRIKPYRKPNASWKDTIKACQNNFVNLAATGTYSPNNSDVHEYSIYGACACEVSVDILTGQHLVTRVDLIQDVGRSVSPLIDIGQVEGAFIMGLGFYTLEKVIFDEDGKVLTDNTWTYWVPEATDIPIDFRVKLPKNPANPLEVLGSKGAGEVPLCTAVAIPFAIRRALASARMDAAASNSGWIPIDGPTDTETIFMNSLNDISQYVL